MSPIHANQPDAAEEPGQRARDLTGICKDIDRLNLTGTGQDDEALQGMNVPDCKLCTALLETSAYIKGHAIAKSFSGKAPSTPRMPHHGKRAC